MEEQAIIQRLAQVRDEHRTLAIEIEDLLAGSGAPDQIHLARLKKRKLALKDEIARLVDGLVPDIIA